MKYISKDTIEIPSVTFMAPSIKKINNDLMNETRRVAKEYKKQIVRYDPNILMMLTFICCMILSAIFCFLNINIAGNIMFGISIFFAVCTYIDPIGIYWSIKRRFIANYSYDKMWRKREKIWMLYQDMFYFCNDMLFDLAILKQICSMQKDLITGYNSPIKRKFDIIYSKTEREMVVLPQDGLNLTQAGLRNPILFEPTGVLFRKEVKKPVLVLEKLSIETPLFVAKNAMTQKKEGFGGYCLLLVLPKKYKKKFRKEDE